MYTVETNNNIKSNVFSAELAVPVSAQQLSNLTQLINNVIGKLDTRYVCSESLFTDFLKQAHQRQLKRLVLAFYRENLLGQLETQQNNWNFSSGNTVKTLVIQDVKTFSLKRVEWQSLLLIDETTGHSEFLTTIAQLLEWVKVISPHIHTEDWLQFENEIANSLINEALMLAYRFFWQNHLKQQLTAKGYNSLWSWLTEELTATEQDVFLEQWGAIGHRYHPGSKTRVGLSDTDNINFSPEFQGEAALSVAALHKDVAHVETLLPRYMGYQQWIAHYFPEQHAAWLHALDTMQIDSANYCLIFIHPWQAEHTIPKKFAHLLESQQLILLPNISYTAKSSMSFRTMLPLPTTTTKAQPHIKLPVAIHTTSVMRTVSPESVKTGPRLSRLLLKILAREPQIAKNLSIMADVVGFHVTKAQRNDDLRHLSAIFRVSPQRRLRHGEVAIPVASLFVESFFNNKPLICEILQAACCEVPVAIMDYFRRYCRITLTACLDLYLVYGIALEAHQQNTLMIFHNDQPVRLLARDLGGLRLHLPSLQATNMALPEGTHSLTFTQSQTVARRKLMHATLQSHLGEMILHLSVHYHLLESDLWQIVVDEMQQRFYAVKGKMSQEKWQTEWQALLEHPWSMKALTRMRLNDKFGCDKDDMQGDIYIDLTNPLL